MCINGIGVASNVTMMNIFTATQNFRANFLIVIVLKMLKIASPLMKFKSLKPSNKRNVYLNKL